MIPFLSLFLLVNAMLCIGPGLVYMCKLTCTIFVGCYADLQASWTILRSGAVLMGHDYDFSPGHALLSLLVCLLAWLLACFVVLWCCGVDILV